MRIYLVKILTLAFFLVCVVSTSASAQTRIGGEDVEVAGRVGAGVASVPDALSGPLAAVDGGVIVQVSRVRLPLDLTLEFNSTEDEGFTFDDSVDRCREEATGRFTDSANCTDIQTAVWGSATLAYDVYVNVESDLRAYVGAGGDIGATTGPHGTFGLHFPVVTSAGMDIEVRAWSNQITLLAAVTF